MRPRRSRKDHKCCSYLHGRKEPFHTRKQQARDRQQQVRPVGADSEASGKRFKKKVQVQEGA